MVNKKQFLKFGFASLILVGLFLTVYSILQPDVEVVSFVEENQEVEVLTNFKIRFSKDMAPQSEVGKWKEKEYVKFTPEIKGKFKWQDSKTLVFSPMEPLKASQKYSAFITDKVSFGKKLDLDKNEFDFHTPFFEAKYMEVYWNRIKNQEFRVSPKCKIVFNYKVDPKEALKYIAVKLDGSSVENLKLTSETASNVVEFSLSEIDQKNKDQKLQVIVKQGLTSVNSKFKILKNIKFEKILPAKDELEIVSAHTGFDPEGNGLVTLKVSQTLKDEEIKKYIQFEPAMDYKIDFFDNHSLIRANFDTKKSYKIIVNKGLKGAYGGVLDKTYTHDLVFGKINSTVMFSDKQGMYLSKSGMKNVAIKTINVDELEVEVYQIFANNLQHFFQSNYAYSYYNNNYSRRLYARNFGKKIYTKKYKIKADENELHSKTLNLAQFKMDEKFSGVYLINIRNADQYWGGVSKVVSMSDIGLIAKQGTDEWTFFVNDLVKTQAMSGVEVSVISKTNQVLLQSKTNADGMVTFKDIYDKIGKYKPSIVTAKTATDFTYMYLPLSKVETSRFDVGGKSFKGGKYNAFIFGDRDLYRPGETVHIASILRDQTRKIVTGFPVYVKVINPKGGVFTEMKKTIDEQGSLELDIDLPKFAYTGTYHVEILTANDSYIGSYAFKVEEFVPDKIKVNANFDEDSYKMNQKAIVQVNANNLFGTPASNRKYELNLKYDYRPFMSKNYPKYSFAPDKPGKYLGSVYKTSKLNADGIDTMSIKTPSKVQYMGYLDMKAFITVFDITNRPVSKLAQSKVYMSDYFIGIERSGYYYSTNTPFTINTIAVNKFDKAATSLNAKVELIRYEWHSTLRKNKYNKTYSYVSEKREVIESSQNITYNASKVPLNYNLSKSGQYELRIYLNGNESYISKNFYAYGWGSSSYTSFEVNKEGTVDIVPDKKSYKPGENAKLLFKTPFEGKMLVTIERNNVLSHYYVSTNKNAAELTVPISGDFLPNVYVTATLFKSAHDKTSPLTVAHGFIPLSVNDASKKLDVSIIAPDKIEPNQEVTFKIKTKAQKNIRIAIAAVDEGICQLTNYKTPNPFKHFYAKQRLDVSTYDLYKFLLPEVHANKSTFGAGGEMEMRTNSVSANRFDLLAIWGGIQTTDANGEINFTAKIPYFNGSMRIMAVAWYDDAFGSSDKNVLIHQPVVVQPALPRFFSPGDQMKLPIALSNTTKSSQDVKVKIKVSGKLDVIGNTQQTITVAPNQDGFVYFPVTAATTPGLAKVEITTTAGSKTDVYSTEIAVRPLSPLVVESGSGAITAGQSLDLPVSQDFLANYNNFNLTLTKFPAVQHSDHLKYLLSYPYGCLEQTVSKVFPQLYFDDLAKMVAPEYYSNKTAAYYVNRGINKIQGMQRYDGSISYWQGASYSSWWASAYAAHFLVEARKAGYDVSNSLLKDLLRYLTTQSKKFKTYEYKYYKDGKLVKVRRVKKEIIYSLYVLALANQPKLSLMNFYKSKKELLTTDETVMLAVSYALAGNQKSYNQLMGSSLVIEAPQRLSSGSFDSPARSVAIMLNALLDIDPNSPHIPVLSKRLADLINEKQVLNTQDRAFTFLALGKMAKENSNADVNGKLLKNGKMAKDFDNSELTYSAKNIANNKYSVSTKGNGKLYYFWSISGLKKSGTIKEEDKYIKVRREFYDRFGKKMTSNQVKINDLIVCKVSYSAFSSSLKNIAITDMIPAGFEIENPRLNNSLPGFKWMKSNSGYDHIDIRDDRIILFTNFTKKEKSYYYLVRATNKGVFKTAPIGAESMYNPMYHSYNGGMDVVVN